MSFPGVWEHPLLEAQNRFGTPRPPACRSTARWCRRAAEPSRLRGCWPRITATPCPGNGPGAETQQAAGQAAAPQSNGLGAMGHCTNPPKRGGSAPHARSSPSIHLSAPLHAAAEQNLQRNSRDPSTELRGAGQTERQGCEYRQPREAPLPRLPEHPRHCHVCCAVPSSRTAP